jgi:sortase B
MDSFEFLKLNPIVTFDTLYERGRYKIFGVMQVNVWRHQGEVFDFWNHVYFNNKSHFDNFVAGILDRSMYYTNVNVEYGDEILLLSTCDFSMFSNGADSSIRLVVAARRVRDNEVAFFTEEEIDAFIDNRGNNAERQSNRLMFEAYYNLRGIDGWAGRNWDLNYIKDFEG